MEEAPAPPESPAALWHSDFGDGRDAALRSLGDEATATVWDSADNSAFGPFEGEQAWHIHIPTDARNGSKVRARFEDLGFEPRAAVRLEYDVFIPSESALDLDLKLPGFASLPAGQRLWEASSGGSKLPHSASIRIHTRPAGRSGVPHPFIEAYAYAHDGGGQTFETWGLHWRLAEQQNATGPATGDEFEVPVGRWFALAIEAEMNTPSNADGRLRVWLDGKQGIGIDDLVWVTAPPYEWTQTMFETFYNAGSHAGTTLGIANMRFSPTTGDIAPAR